MIYLLDRNFRAVNGDFSAAISSVLDTNQGRNKKNNNNMKPY